MISIFSKRLKGGALYYALFVLMVLGMICGLLLMYVQVLFQEDTLFYQSNRLNDNLDSALEMICSSPSDFPNGEQGIDLFGDGNDSVSVSIIPWGVLRIIDVGSKWHHLLNRKIVMAGLLDKTRWAVWMPDMGSYISMVGNSSVSGNCSMCDLGFRKGNVEGQYFTGPYLVRGEIVKSPKKMIEPETELIKYLSELVVYVPTDNDSVVELMNTDKSYRQPFVKPLLVVEKKGNFYLDKGQYNGKILIHATDTLFVGGNVSLSQTIVSARVIKFAKGFQGNLQAVASEGIFAEQGCKFSYPSYMLVAAQSADAKIEIGAKCELDGGAMLFSENAQPGKTMLLIEKGVKFKGKAYVNGQISLKSNVIGGVYCTQFVHKTERAYYENFLFDTRIESLGLPVGYVSFCLKDEMERYRIVEQLN